MGFGRGARMGRGGRSLVLLCCFATLLLISASAVNGVLNENGREFRRFVGRFGREHLDGELPRPIANADDVTEEPKQLEWDTAVDEKKPADGIWEKARSFVSGISTLVGNGIPNPAASVVEETKSAPSEKVEKSFGTRDHTFGRHHGLRRSHWAGIRDLIRNHPERIAAADGITATEPLDLREDVTPVTEDFTAVTPGEAMLAKIRDIVMTVAEEHHALTVETNVASTCADALEEQVKIFVKSVKFALLERLCNADVSTEEQPFCNLLNDHPMMATFASFWMTDVNPVKVPWHETSKTAACSSVNSFRDFAESLKEIEGLARDSSMLLPEVIDMENMHMGYGHGHHMFRERRLERGGRGRHWWQRMSHKHMMPDEEVLDVEDQKKPSWQRFLISKFMTKLSGERHEHGDREKRWWHHEPNENELGRHGLHGPRREGSSWPRVFGMFRQHRHMRHHGFEGAHGNSERDVCFHRSAKYLTRGIKHHLATTCQSATAPNVIAACEFAKEHHFLVKAWLAVKMPVFTKAAKSCVSSFENRHAPAHGMGDDGVVEKPVDAEVLGSSDVGKTNERQLNTLSHRMRSGCARRQANREFGRALHLRGHIIGMSSHDNGENGLRGRVQTHLIVLEGGNVQHLRGFHHVFQNLTPQHYDSYGEMMSDLQGRLDEFVRESEAVSGEHRTEMMLKPFRHHTRGPHFRISAMPRVAESNEMSGVAESNEMPVLEPSDFDEELSVDKSSKDAAENIAVM